MEDGHAVLRTRADGATELRVNGVFVMDDGETGSERRLARSVLERAHEPSTVVVGGLGLGFTVRELLADARVARVVVAEIEPALPAWMRDGTIPGADLLDDPRVSLHVGDVRGVVGDLPAGSVDAILLDVDNGPDFLVYDDNAAVYEAPFVRACATRLRPRGRLTVWSQADSEPLRSTLAESFCDVRSERVEATLQRRAEAYWLLHATGPRVTTIMSCHER